MPISTSYCKKRGKSMVVEISGGKTFINLGGKSLHRAFLTIIFLLDIWETFSTSHCPKRCTSAF
jgi:hypothetical protein